MSKKRHLARGPTALGGDPGSLFASAELALLSGFCEARQHRHRQGWPMCWQPPSRHSHQCAKGSAFDTRTSQPAHARETLDAVALQALAKLVGLHPSTTAATTSVTCWPVLLRAISTLFSRRLHSGRASCNTHAIHPHACSPTQHATCMIGAVRAGRRVCQSPH